MVGTYHLKTYFSLSTSGERNECDVIARTSRFSAGVALATGTLVLWLSAGLLYWLRVGLVTDFQSFLSAHFLLRNGRSYIAQHRSDWASPHQHTKPVI